jgi:hypothetical protein
MSSVEMLELLGLALGLGFVAGINFYAVVLALGIGIQLGALQLPTPLQGLTVLGDPIVLALAAASYAVEFVADKVSWLDGAWDIIHTFIRPVGAAALMLLAAGGADPAIVLAAALLGGGTALAAHAAKAGLRLVANTSPEPFCNIGLSLAEDVVALVGSWIVASRPVLSGLVVALGMIGGLPLAPRLARVVRLSVLSALTAVERRTASRRAPAGLLDDLPSTHAGLLCAIGHSEPELAVRCVSGAGLGTPRHLVGFLSLAQQDLLFVTRQGFRVRAYPIDLSRIDEIRHRRGLFLDRITLYSRLRRAHLYFLHDGGDRLERVLAHLDRARRSRARKDRARSDAVAA